MPQVSGNPAAFPPPAPASPRGLPHLHELNLYNDNKLLVFPIKDLTETNPVYILTNKDKAYVEGTDGFKNLLKNAVEDLEVSDM